MTTSGKKDIKTALLEATKTLSSNESISTPRLDCEILLCHLLSCVRIDLVLKQDSVLSEDVLEHFSALVLKRKENTPISYLTGRKEFMSLEFSVAPGVLIPRPETELLVESVIEELKQCPKPQILDLCTGSGAIAVSLAHYLKNAFVIAIDKFDICVNTAIENAKKNCVNDRVDVKKTDILEEFSLDKTFDCIVSNPPYIEKQVLTSLPDDVKKYEPHYALDGGEDGLVFYRRIACIAEKFLAPGGILVLEIGYDQGKSVPEILAKSNIFKDIQVTKDYAGQDRLVTAFKKET